MALSNVCYRGNSGPAVMNAIAAELE